jgi:dihydroorotate dehydrogenase
MKDPRARYVTESAGLSSVLTTPVELRSQIMGLHFKNPLGLAAGFDRTGRLLSNLAPLGFGHIEVGTVTRRSAHRYLLRATLLDVCVGVSIGSGREGVGQQVVDDYVATFSKVWPRADYIVANLSSPFTLRDGNAAGIELLLEQLVSHWHSLSRLTGRYVPLLVKVACSVYGGLPTAMTLARDLKLSGVVLVSDSLSQITAARKYLGGGTVISVGGIVSAADVRDRMSAGASLVQIYTAFVRDGPCVVRQVLADFENML